MQADIMAQNEHRDYITYTELEKTERRPEFRSILRELAEQEAGHYQFWKKYSRNKDFRVSPLHIAWVKILRRVFGFTFIVKFLERNERVGLEQYRSLLQEAPLEMRDGLAAIIKSEEEHEEKLINNINEEKVRFTGNIVLGLNDGLIELTGALVGFASAFEAHLVVAMAGLITGITASFSMASSAYLQAKQEVEANAVKSAWYTGIAYLIVVLVLVAPFLVIANVSLALFVMAGLLFAIIAIVSFYTSVLRDKKFSRQFGEMMLFSIGVAVLGLIVGFLFKKVSGVAL